MYYSGEEVEVSLVRETARTWASNLSLKLGLDILDRGLEEKVEEDLELVV